MRPVPHLPLPSLPPPSAPPSLVATAFCSYAAQVQLVEGFLQGLLQAGALSPAQLVDLQAHMEACKAEGQH